MNVVTATVDLVPLLLERMGPERTAAIEARIGAHPEAEIVRNIEKSSLTWAGLDAAGVVVLGGVITAAPSTGLVWQFITDGIRQNRRAYIEMSRDLIRRSREQFEVLVVQVESANPAALRHIRRVGFQIGPLEELFTIPAHTCVLRAAP